MCLSQHPKVHISCTIADGAVGSCTVKVCALEFLDAETSPTLGKSQRGLSQGLEPKRSFRAVLHGGVSGGFSEKGRLRGFFMGLLSGVPLVVVGGGGGAYGRPPHPPPVRTRGRPLVRDVVDIMFRAFPSSGHTHGPGPPLAQAPEAHKRTGSWELHSRAAGAPQAPQECSSPCQTKTAGLSSCSIQPRAQARSRSQSESESASESELESELA